MTLPGNYDPATSAQITRVCEIGRHGCSNQVATVQIPERSSSDKVQFQVVVILRKPFTVGRRCQG